MRKLRTIEELYEIIAELTKRVEFLEKENLRIGELEKENDELKQRLSKYETRKDSHNSSLPPSKDENRPKRNQSLREKSDRSVGGQKGHEGQTLEMTENPDKIETHIPCYCEKCGNNLSQVPYEYVGRRQVIEIPPIKPQVIEHQVYKKSCKCGHETISSYPENIKTPVSYGSNVESLIGYFHTRQYIPFARMEEIFRDIFSLAISEGGLHYLLERLAEKAAPAYEMIRKTVFGSQVIGTDETGAKINGKKSWFWTWQNKVATLISVSFSRGFDTIEENCGNLTKKAILVHDCWKPHFQTPSSGHQLCVAHLLRELNYLQDKDKIRWPKDFKAVLMNALKLKKQFKPNDYYCPNKQRDEIEYEVTNLLEQTIEDKFKDTISFQRRMLKYRDNLLTFLYHPKVPPDNNDSEKAIRNIKVKLKVSGQFKSKKGAEIFAVLRSITDTAIKNGQNVLHALNIIANFKIQTD